MNLEHFWHTLNTEYGYRSPKRHRFLVGNLPGWATFIYYAQLFHIVFQESLTAHRKTYDQKTWARGSLGVLKIVESAGGKLHVSGLKALSRQQRPLVYIANHMSLLDTLVLPCLLLAIGPVTFVVKEGLLNYPFFGSIVKAIHPIAVSRQNPREDLKVVLTEGKEVLSRGHSIVIFPQATRSKVFDAASFNSLGVKLARKAGAPVVPIALKTDFQGNGRIIKDMGAVDPKKELFFTFGEAMNVEGNGQATHQNVVRFISENLEALGVAVYPQKSYK